MNFAVGQMPPPPKAAAAVYCPLTPSAEAGGELAAGGAADQPGRAAGGAGASPAPCGGADRGRVPILVVEEDPPLDMDKFRPWTKRKLAKREEGGERY